MKTRVKQHRLPTSLVAAALVERQPLAASLTCDEKKRAAAILSGTRAAPDVANMEITPLFKACLVSALAEMGVTSQYMAEHAKDGLEATKPYGKEGVHSADWMARHKYFTTTLTLLGVTGEGNEGAHATQYKSKLRTDGEIIDVTPPKSDIAKRRMAAVRPNNRKEE